MKRFLLLSTGGTIASAPSANGLAPKYSGEDMIALVPKLRDLCQIDCKAILNLDSSNIQPEEWKLIARETFEGLKEYDGVVITHGTDSMAYTSSILSFMLRNISKPVILTGSQLPIMAPNTDGKRNLYHAFLTANSGIPGVYIVFNRKIIRGSRAVKVQSLHFNAFESINSPNIGKIVKDNVLLSYKPSPPQGSAPALDDRIDPRVFLLKLVPGTPPEILDSIIKLGFSGVVIESLGAGGLPYLRRDLVSKIRELIAAGIAVVVITQCLYEGSDLTIYEVGQKVAQAGAISGYNMTTEAAVTKLMWALGHTHDLSEVKKIMLTDYCGEINIE